MPDRLTLPAALVAGMRRERALTVDRGRWTSWDWQERREFLHAQIAEESDPATLAELQGRLLEVCVVGFGRYGDLDEDGIPA